jgi:hypothetical protein
MHGSKVDAGGENVVSRRLSGRTRTPIETSGNSCSTLREVLFKEETVAT